ncbi:MAG TPA: DegQ family serine endoprotease [Rhizomicrobium sp.]|jgi:serine protease Do
MRFFLSAAAALIVLLLLPAPALAKAPPDSFADLTQQLLPTVVNISTSETLNAAPGGRGNIPDLPPGSPLGDLFKDFLGPNKQAPRHVTSLGSGFIIDQSGLIVTNNHVIEGGQQITVTLADGRSLPAKLLGRDDKTDLALLKVNSKSPLPFAHFGDSDKARIGDWVIAIGNPFGLGSTVTVGVVSARNRDINAGPYDDFIQTDASINRGNSGGPLFDAQGNVVGVNSAIFSPSGGSVGIGFSIPSNLAKQVIGQLRQFGSARRGWIGVRIQALTDDIAEGMNLPNTHGAIITQVTPNGPAAKAGIHNGDLVVGFDGKPVQDSRALSRMVADTAIGKTTNIDVLRNGQKSSLKISIARLDETPMKPPPGMNKTPPPKLTTSKLSRLGLSVGNLDTNARGQYHINPKVQGVVVTNVDSGSPAEEKNIRAGDVIVAIHNQPMHTPDEVVKRVDADTNSGSKVVLMLINRDGALTYVALKLAG